MNKAVLVCRLQLKQTVPELPEHTCWNSTALAPDPVLDGRRKAQLLGLTIPKSLLASADGVID